MTWMSPGTLDVWMPESVLFGLVPTWPASTGAPAGTLGVPLVDGLGEPAARASDVGVRLGELVGGEGAGLDFEPVGDFGEAQVSLTHRGSLRIWRQVRSLHRARVRHAPCR